MRKIVIISWKIKTRPTSYKNPDVSFRLLIMEIPVLSIAEIGLQNESHPKLDALTVTKKINILYNLSIGLTRNVYRGDQNICFFGPSIFFDPDLLGLFYTQNYASESPLGGSGRGLKAYLSFFSGQIF